MFCVIPKFLTVPDDVRNYGIFKLPVFTPKNFVGLQQKLLAHRFSLTIPKKISVMCDSTASLYWNLEGKLTFE